MKYLVVITDSITFSSKGDVDIIDITPKVAEVVKKSKLNSGTVTIFVPGATGAVSTIEYEPGLLKDVPEALEVFSPTSKSYHHHKTWGCDNGRSHVRATILGPSLVVPFVDGSLTLGTWQQIAFIELDTRSRSRKLICQIIGE